MRDGSIPEERSGVVDGPAPGLEGRTEGNEEVRGGREERMGLEVGLEGRAVRGL